MPQRLIIDNIVLGDQFAIPPDTVNEIKISDIYYDLYRTKSDVIVKNNNYLLFKNKIILNLLDDHDIDNISKISIIAGLKFLNSIDKSALTYIHCQMGISRSASLVFIYLVANKLIKETNFKMALNYFLVNYYPFMKLNYGMYQFLVKHFPYDQLIKLTNLTWDELHE